MTAVVCRVSGTATVSADLQDAAESGERFRPDLVEDAPTVPDAVQQAGIDQFLQVVGDGRLANSHPGREVTDCDRDAAACGDLGEDAQAGGVGESGEQPGVPGRFIRGQWAGPEAAAVGAEVGVREVQGNSHVSRVPETY